MFSENLIRHKRRAEKANLLYPGIMSLAGTLLILTGLFLIFVTGPAERAEIWAMQAEALYRAAFTDPRGEKQRMAYLIQSEEAMKRALILRPYDPELWMRMVDITPDQARALKALSMAEKLNRPDELNPEGNKPWGLSLEK